MRIELETTKHTKITLKDISEFCFTQTAGVACDSLWAYFFSKDNVPEITVVKAYKNDRLIFNGFCDCQKNTINEKGNMIYFYARSSACLLVDNEAEPFTYEKPSARQLVFSIAEKYGFTSSLPEIHSDMKYEVTKGTSCYGAISQFVSLLTGDCLFVTPENEICVLRLGDNVKGLGKYSVMSAVHTINRAQPYSQIVFKKSYAQPRYGVHTCARVAEELNIDRKAYINLSSLPQWQRENIISQKLRASYKDYKVLELKVCGYADEELFSRFDYHTGNENYSDYVLTQRKYVCDKYGEHTVLTLRKNVDVKEFTYVD